MVAQIKSKVGEGGVTFILLTKQTPPAIKLKKVLK